jgi:serine/threonine-protein kinase
MTPDFDDLTAREKRLCMVIAAYYQAAEQGRAPPLGTLIDQNPDLEAELTRYFFEQEKLHRVAEPLRALDRTDQGGFKTLAGSPGGEAVTSTGDRGAGAPPDLIVTWPLADGLRRFGDYELLEELAIGGMGVIYKARQVSLNRLVALKMIRSGEFATESDVRRFRAEAETIADLDHPHIVPIYEVGEHGGYHFFSMKLLEGGTLAAHLDRYRSDPRVAAEVVAKLARAIHHAHQRGVLHRDLKPSNILVDARGEPLIADFGLAKRLDATTDLTATGAIIGTAPYFAPELTLGRKGAVTTATDVYGLGVILYALLTGRAPFQADSFWEMIEKVKEQSPQPPRQLNPRIDVDLQTICLKCLEKDPGERYGSARDLAEDLERWLNGEMIVARPTNRRHQTWLWCRHPARQREAGADAMLVGVLLTIWACLGITLIALGLIETPAPGELILHVSGWIALAYLPMILIGWHARQGKVWAIRAGLIHAIALMTINTINLLGLYRFGAERFAPDDDPISLSLSLTLYYVAVAFVVAVYAIANISLAANRRPGASERGRVGQRRSATRNPPSPSTAESRTTATSRIGAPPGGGDRIHREAREDNSNDERR